MRLLLGLFIAGGALGTLGLAGCGDDARPEPAAPPPPTRLPAVSRGLPTVGADGKPLQSIQITQVMVVYRSSVKPAWPRSREQASVRAQEILEKARRGVPMEDLVKQYTDDLTDDAVRVPFNRGSYSLHPADPKTAALFAVAKALPVGVVAPEPHDTGYAFLVIRRDR